MKRFFSIYQFVVPLILFPLAYYLWLERYNGDHTLALLTLSIPIIYAYAMPGIGTNVLKLWEFNTRFRLGRFRPQHGFVFGTGTSLLVFIVTDYPISELTEWTLFKTGFIVFSVLSYWNWYYDTKAFQSGFIRIHVQPFLRFRDPASIAMEHSPTLFGVFGLVYAVWLQTMQYVIGEWGRYDLVWMFFGIGLVAAILIPVGCFSLRSYLKYGDFGLKPKGDIGYYDPERNTTSRDT